LVEESCSSTSRVIFSAPFSLQLNPIFLIRRLICIICPFLFIADPIDKARVFEGKLMAQLEQRGNSENNWAKEIAALDSQRVNPMMRSRARMMDFIAKRKAKLGL
jgi:hypothetical protein